MVKALRILTNCLASCSCLSSLNKFLISRFWFIPASGSSGSAGTAYRLDSQDSVDDPSNSWAAIRQTSISLREWDIPYEELNIGEKIGSGRFSTGKIDLGYSSLLFSIAPKSPQSCSRMFFAFLAFEHQHQ